ncbi:MAG: Rpn family recombination-promoting nuclease/putative transposase [Treponema sp.]|nr:Rpn family recombination-promoting nuclease/putative transposase [Treponema sp.]
MIKPYDELEFTDDFLFCKIMQDTEICRQMLEILLKIKIEKVELKNQQQIFNVDPIHRGVRLDVFVKDSRRMFDIEIQTSIKHDEAKRARYYQSQMDVSNLMKGEKISNLKESYVIFLCKTDPFCKGLPIYTFSNLCHEDKEFRLGDESYKYFFNAEAFSKLNDDSEIKNFLEYISTNSAKNDFTKTLEKKVFASKVESEWRADYMKLELLLDETRVEGYEQGEQAKAFETAKTMLEDNVPEDLIMKYTGLSAEDLKKIKTE